MSDIEVILARHDERITRLEDWAESQNGRLSRIEEKLDKFYFWLVGVMGGVIASLVLLIVNLATRGR